MKRFVLISGKVHKITAVHADDLGPDYKKVTYVEKVVVRHSKSGKSPGPGWRANPNGEPRSWLQNQPQYETKVVPIQALTDERPEGLEDCSVLESTTALLVRSAVRAGGQNALIAREMIDRSLIVQFCEENQLPLPTQLQWKTLLEDAWDKESKGKKTRNSIQIPPEATIQVPTRTTMPAVRQETVRREGGLSDQQESVTLPPPEPKADEPKVDEDKGAEIDDSQKPNLRIAEVEEQFPAPPDGVVVPEGHRWSLSAERSVPVGRTGELLEKAIANGWSEKYLDGAGQTKKGDAGFNLAYMSRTEFDAESHGK